MARKIEVEIIGDASSLHRAFQQAGKSSSTFGSKLASVAKGAAFAAGAAGLGALAVGLKAGISEWTQSTRVTAQTAAVLKATGGVANVTAKHVDELANSLLRKTGIDDEAIRANENLLLRFKAVRNEVGQGNAVFDRATIAIQDMAVATGKSADALTLKLGKALEDPAKGLTRLAQLGIHFSDAQKEQIKSLEESGHALEAQKMILSAVEDRYRGAAEAAGKTLPGQLAIAREEFNNFAGDMVAKLVPAVSEAISWLRDHWPEINTAIQGAVATVTPILSSLGALFKSVVDVIRDNWGTIGPIVEQVAQAVQAAGRVIGAVIKLVADLLHGDWSAAWNDAKAIVSNVLKQMEAELRAAVMIWKPIALALGNAILDGIQAGASAVAGWVGGLMSRTVAAIQGAVGAAFSAAASFGSAILKGVASSLEGFGAMLVRLIKAPLNAIIGAWNAIGFEFDIPSVDTHVPGIGTIGGGHLSFHVPQIPTLDTGAIVMGPTLAMLAANNKPEAVIPLDRMGGGDTIVNVYAGWVANDQQLTDKLVSTLRRYSARNNGLGFA